MNRKEAKILMPVIQAFADGKDVETKTSSGWISIENMSLAGNPDSYRIKPEQEPKYRPFKDAEECWQEMQKHQPIGWTKLIGAIEYSFITDVDDNTNYSGAIKEYTFADGTPFGVKEE